MYATQNNKSSTLNISLNRNKDGKSEPTNMSCYKLQQSEIEKQQQLFHMMGSATPAYGGHPSATHFLASLLQNPTVLQNPELMASVAGMLQSSLNPHIVGGPMGVAAGPAGPAPTAQDQMPQTGNCFRNFSIPTSDTSSQLQSIINSCHGGAASSIHAESCGDQSSQRSPSSTSSHHKYGRKSSDRFSASSHASSDNESHNSVDIGKFANSSELVINKVMTVIEEILANDNIRKNNFLAKLFEDQGSNNTFAGGNNKKDKRPEILVKRVAGFKRVKAITTEFKVVQAAMGMSKMFDLGADGLSAFRMMPLPQLGSEDQQTNNNKDQTQQKLTQNSSKIESSTPSKDQQRIVKKVLAINFTSADFTIEKVTNIFEKIGEIAQISLIRPKRKIPDFLTEYAQWVPDLGTKPCAVIDFENQEAAQNACREINLSNRLGNGIRCALLKPGARIKRTLYRKYNSDTVSTDKTISNESSTTMTCNNQKTYSRTSMDSGVSHNSPLDDQTPFKKHQTNFNRKNVKKAISKHFISLGAWKNSSEQPNGVLEGNYAVLSNISGFIRQPKGPVGQGFGLRRTIMI